MDGVSAIDPTVNDDDAAGFQVLSVFLNTTSGSFFRCIDASAGAAQWVEVGIDSVLEALQLQLDNYIIANDAVVAGKANAVDLTNHEADTSTHGVSTVAGL